MSSGAIVGIAAVVIVAVLLAGLGVYLVTRDPSDGDATPDPAPTDDGGTDDGGTDDGGTDDGQGEDEAPTIDGVSRVEAFVAADDTNPHQVSVPAGTTATVTIHPATSSFDPDAFASDTEEEFTDSTAGEDEVIEVTAPTDQADEFILEVYGYESTAGDYVISIVLTN